MGRIQINGKVYDSFQEWINEQSKDPDSDSVFWTYQDIKMMIGDRILDGTGKCSYKGKTYEGKIEYRGNDLYVGGEFVKTL